MDNNKFTNSEVSSVHIFWTKDYGMFRFLKGNRDLNELKIKRIIRSVEDGLEFFKYCPIMINSEGYVIDGQHRLYVCKKLGLNVYYVIVPDFSLRQVAEMNNNASKWKEKDYLNCYIDVGIEHYKVLSDFIDKYHINIGIAISLLSLGRVQSGGGSRDDFRDGLFKVNFHDHACKLMNAVSDFKEYCESWNSRSFIHAVQILRSSKDYKHDDFMIKLQRHDLLIERRSTSKDYLAQMEGLYNYHNSGRKRLY